MRERTATLIVLRLALGLVLLGASAVAGIGFVSAKQDLAVAGCAMAAVATFACGIYFCAQALDQELWRDRPDKQPLQSADDADENHEQETRYR